MTEWLIDRNGRMPLFLYHDRFISEQGHNLGWLIGNNVFSLTGNHLGWFEHGILYDGNNDIVALAAHPTAHKRSFPVEKKLPQMPDAPMMPGLSDTPWRPLTGGRSNKTLEEFFGFTPIQDVSHVTCNCNLRT